MAESESTSLPNILWRIQKYSTCKKTSCTLSFLGTSWKLIFNRIFDGGEKKIIIRLKCLNASENLKSLKLCSYACIFNSFASNGEYFPLKTELNLKDEEWCVWSHSLCSIASQFPCSFADLCFSLKIFPEDMRRKSTALEKIREQTEEEKATCTTVLIQDFSTLYNSSEHSDFELKCKGWRVPVHKVILSARSGYFAALFRSQMKEADKGYVEFDDVEPETLQHVIYYLYSGKLPELSGDSIREVYAVADRFDIESLRTKCTTLVMADFMKEYQIKTDNDTPNQEMENLPDPCDDKRDILLKQLFRSFKWKILSEEDPALAEKMCKPILLDIPKL